VNPELVEQLLKSVEKPEELLGPDGLLHRLKGALMERMLEAEMSEHLGYETNEAKGRNTGNSRNGHSSKTVQTESGPVEIRVPRDRKGSFAPQLIPKHQRRLDGFDDKVLALYSRGMSVRDIQGHLRELYGTDVSADLISRVTDAVLDEVKAWQARPLEAVYPVVYLDALFVSVRDGGSVTKKAVYIALGVGLDGNREVLGFWSDATEGARFWLTILTELKNRGVEDIFFVCCDGLTGLPQAIEAAFPKAVVQTCIVHMIRSSLRYVTWGDRKAVAAALRPVYAAENEEAARRALAVFEERWGGKYPTIAKQWARAVERDCALLGLSARDSTGLVYDQHYRVSQLPTAKGAQAQRPLPHRRRSGKTLVPGAATRQAALEAADLLATGDCTLLNRLWKPLPRLVN
jgi:putative transposase